MADIYEFTYDPSDEPPPQKKKKRVVSKKKKKPAKPKTVTFKNFYDKNLSQTLNNLKDVLSKKHTQIPEAQTEPITELNSTQKQQPNAASEHMQNKPLVQQKLAPVQQNIAPKQVQQQINSKSCSGSKVPVSKPRIASPTITGRSAATQPSYNFSIPIEDIAADLDATPHHEINYSPIHSVNRNTNNLLSHRRETGADVSTHSTDPLNIRGDLSFFDDEPVASSSMIVSAHHPHASPWRAEFNKLPIKWHVNSYMKANMTPAVECSFVNFGEGKKHVYTDMVPEADDALPEIVQNEQPNMVQTSILSFYKEVVENSAKKNKRSRSKTPGPSTTENSAKKNKRDRSITPPASAIFDVITSAISQPARILNTPKKSVEKNNNMPVKDPENFKRSARIRQKAANKSDENVIPTKTVVTEKEGLNETLFGFEDDLASEDLENISPKEKKNPNVRGLRTRSRAVNKVFENLNNQKTKELNSRTRSKRKNENNENVVPTKAAGKEIVSPKENPFFGFQESGDLENICPDKNENEKVRGLRSRPRAVNKVSENINNNNIIIKNSRTRQKNKNGNNENVDPAKAAGKEIDSPKENPFFGFEESEDIENISPNKKVNEKILALRNAVNKISESLNNDKNKKQSPRIKEKRKTKNNENVVSSKTTRKAKDSMKENTYFGFDVSADLENISPNEKENEKVQAVRSRSRAVLREINAQTGPTRALIPHTVKSTANQDVVNKLFEGLKSAEEAPYIADEIIENPEITTVTETAATGAENDVLDEDSESVHLFEDIEFCHHFNKPQRKSYGKAKKVTIRQPSSDSDSQLDPAHENRSSGEEDNVLDLSFEMPAEERKTRKRAAAGKTRVTKKQKLNKKEAAEAEAWAAGFNSMCEDVEEFPLVVESC